MLGSFHASAPCYSQVSFGCFSPICSGIVIPARQRSGLDMLGSFHASAPCYSQVSFGCLSPICSGDDKDEVVTPPWTGSIFHTSGKRKNSYSHFAAFADAMAAVAV